MEAFQEYLLQEYNDTNAVCNAFKYSHSAKQKLDKASKIPIVNNVITVKIDCYDKQHNLLATHSEKFVDGAIQRNKKNKLINIAPAELNNRFAAAKQAIANGIMAEYLQKLNDINEKIDSLNAYVNVSGIIPTEFVNEPLIASSTQPQAAPVHKNFEF